MYFVTQAALTRHKRAKVCRSTDLSYWSDDDESTIRPVPEDECTDLLVDSESAQLQVQVDAAQGETQSHTSASNSNPARVLKRNIFDLFTEQFEECD